MFLLIIAKSVGRKTNVRIVPHNKPKPKDIARGCNIFDCPVAKNINVDSPKNVVIEVIIIGLNLRAALCINEVINLLGASFKASEIDVVFKYEEDIVISSFKGELLQVLFNILNNSKDEFIRRKIKDAQIIITIKKSKDEVFIKILDNAKGIDSKIIKKIFEPYFTTKDKGLGVGLYMSKMIVEKNMGGELSVENHNDGALFTICLNLNH